MSGPRIFYLCARRSGSLQRWDRWLEEACRLGCDWIWIGDLAPRRAGVHPLAAAEPGKLARELAPGGDPEEALRCFLAAARGRGLQVATDFSPAFMDRAAEVVRAHPEWFVRGPAGTAAVPAGMGSDPRLDTLAECDFAGTAVESLSAFWSGVASRLAHLGMDALICRAAHRVPAPAWQQILASVRRIRPGIGCWAETLGADVAASEALDVVGFDAFFSSACWWDFHSGWFLEQERRLRRLGPTISFPDLPWGEWRAAGETTEQEARRTAHFRYGFAAASTWGVVVPMGYAQGWRKPLGEHTTDDPDRFDLGPQIAAVNGLRARLAALSHPSRLWRLSGADARACALTVQSSVGNKSALVVALNPSRERHAEVQVGAWFADLDRPAARGRESTPGRTPQSLDAASHLALEPQSVRWFEIDASVAPASSRATADIEEALAEGPIGIERVQPTVDEGEQPLKRVLGETVDVSADLIAEGHGTLGAAVRYRALGEESWTEVILEPVGNDHWEGQFVPDRVGEWRFQVLAWRDRFRSWQADGMKRRDAGQSFGVELDEGEQMVVEALSVARDEGDCEHLEVLHKRLASHWRSLEARADLLLSDTVGELVSRVLPRVGLSASREFVVNVERGRATAGAWYECFPRSLGPAGRHGTFDDLVAHLPYIADLGFDVLYLPPIHPIGHTNRKGRNNALVPEPGDPGSPWAIGSEEGGHMAINPELGTLADFRRLLVEAKAMGLEVALDFAIQCSPDHPWIREHPEWFQWRPDGSIRHAENPPKKYEDIVNVDFMCADRRALWIALRDVVLYWCKQGVRLFRVDNPHTKPLRFWEWLIASVRASYPDTVFLSEAFTRPKVMHRLAKIGFSQSYTYFTWRDSKAELMEYLGEISRAPACRYFRPNFWVNTPDINPYYLHDSGRAGFVIRATLAATMVGSWGMYSGYELCEHEPLRNTDGTAREEYLDAEKYELKQRDFEAPGNIRAEIAALNRVRRDNPAMRREANIAFHDASDDAVIFYSRHAPDNVLWMLVNLDPHNARGADISLPLEMLGADDASEIRVEELLAGQQWSWYGRFQRVWLDPSHPAMVLRVTTGDS